MFINYNSGLPSVTLPCKVLNDSAVNRKRDTQVHLHDKALNVTNGSKSAAECEQFLPFTTLLSSRCICDMWGKWWEKQTSQTLTPSHCFFCTYSIHCIHLSTCEYWHYYCLSTALWLRNGDFTVAMISC